MDASAATTNAKTNAATTNAAIAASDTNNAIIVNAASAAVNDDLPHHQLNNEATTMPPSPSPAPLPVRGAVLRWMDTLPTTGIFSHMYYFASNMSELEWYMDVPDSPATSALHNTTSRSGRKRVNKPARAAKRHCHR